jgi:hypothetical protein
MERIPDTKGKAWEYIDQSIAKTTPAMSERVHENSKRQLPVLKTTTMGMKVGIGLLKALPKVTSNAQPMGIGVTVKHMPGTLVMVPNLEWVVYRS